VMDDESGTSSGTARMLVKPLRKTMKTLRAPHRNADVAQSNAVSPTPSTIALPCSTGRRVLQAHIPVSPDHTQTHTDIRSSADADRPRDASCLSVVSFNRTIISIELLMLVTSVGGLAQW